MSEERPLSPRVNSQYLSKFIGSTVRVPCKLLQFSGDHAKIETSDGAQVMVILGGLSSLAEAGVDYVEVIGVAQDATTIRLQACIPLGSDLDMSIVERTIQIIHDPRYFERIFS